jgi:hypothetical protein
MAMKSRSVTAVVVMFTAYIVAAAWGQVHLPKGLQGVIPKYPGAKIVVAEDKGNNSHALMKAQDNSRSVLIYYRKAMLHRGWNLISNMSLDRGAKIILSKGDQMLYITAQESEEGKTTILVTIAKQ